MPVNAVVNFAPAAATRRSPASAMPRPAPAAAPLMPTTTGTRSPASASISGLYSSSTTDSEVAALPRRDSTCSARSWPTQNARPVPVRTTARTDSSPATSVTAASRSPRSAWDRPGRCRVIVATPSASSRVTVSDIVVVPPSISAGQSRHGKLYMRFRGQNAGIASHARARQRVRSLDRERVDRGAGRLVHLQRGGGVEERVLAVLRAAGGELLQIGDLGEG